MLTDRKKIGFFEIYVEISKQPKSFLPSVLSSLYRLPLISETKKEKKVKRRPKNLVLNSARHDTRNRGNVVGCGQSLTNELETKAILPLVATVDKGLTSLWHFRQIYSLDLGGSFESQIIPGLTLERKLAERKWKRAFRSLVASDGQNLIIEPASL